jgi:hypothetical protein
MYWQLPHQLYINLSDNGWLVARCGCDDWHKERRLKIDEDVTEAVRELEEEFQQHALSDEKTSISEGVGQ